MKTVLLSAVALLTACSGCDDEPSKAATDAATDARPAADQAVAMTPRCQQITDSITAAGFDVTVRCDGTYAWLGSDTYPDHEVMTGIVGTNEQTAVPALDYESPIRLDPVKAATYTTIDAAVGVAVNGVPIYDYSAAGELDPTEYDPRVDTVITGQLDVCNGHAGRGDDYHYHAAPTCMIDAMPNKADNPIIGWGFDGYPLFGDNNPDGTAIAAGALGACNEQADTTFGWRYHTSAAPPYIIQCLVGEIDARVLPRVPPLRGQAGGDKPSGTPPRGGVEGLTLTRTGAARSMRYTYEADAYYINYAPSGEPGCYDFDWKTVSYGTDSGTFCR